MTIQVWKTNFIGLNKPSKVLSGTADSYTSISLWPYANGADDPYWSGGINPQFYRWQVNFTVNERIHGSHLTRTPFRFNAQDIDVGDFVAGAQDGKVCQIISIVSKDDNHVVAIVEDVLRYNTFRDAAGFGLFGCPGQVIFFQINELGYPMLDPIPGEASSDFADNVLGRFQYLNPLLNYVLEKENNGFVQGDAICIENGTFALSDANNVGRFVGTVVHEGPGPHQFILRPANGIIDFVPNMPGVVGDYIYPTIDGSGRLTTSDASRRPIYMKLASAISSITTGTGVDPAPHAGEVIEINRYQIPFTGFSLDQAIIDINNGTFYHSVTAVKVGAATKAISGAGGLITAYGVVAGYEPFKASINGVEVNFKTTVSGSKAYGDPTVADANDMVIDINNTNIPDITASVDASNNLVITNMSGGAITIVNISPDANGKNFAGPGSVSALPLLTSANTTTHALRLIREDGGPIIIRDIQGTFLYRCGVMSGQTGRFALGLNIEQGLRSSATRVVADITARDALYPLVGDQVYVINDEHNEWAVFIYDGAEWQRTGNKRSEETDAKTINLDINLATATSGTFPLTTISAGRKIIDITVESLGTGFGNTVTVGTRNNLSLLMSSLDSNLSKDGRYSVTTNYITTDFTDILVSLNITNHTGTLSVKLTYV